MKKPILDAATAALKLERMAYQILEDNLGEKELVLAGIATNGGIIAENIRSILSNISDIQIHSLQIRLDKKKPAQITLSEPFDFNEKVVIVVDDVSNSGKTMLYALKPFLDFHPKKIQTLVLVERTHKAFPVLSDYVGLSVATTLQEHIIVEVSGDHVTGAYLE